MSKISCTISHAPSDDGDHIKGTFMGVFVSGCMAERLKMELLEREKLVDVLAGPDAYRDLPRLLAVSDGGQQACNVLLSLEETYADVMPVHHAPRGHSAFVYVVYQMVIRLFL